MKLHYSLVFTAVMLALGVGPAAAQSDESSIQLVVQAGRPLRVTLDRRVTVKRVGQPVTATLVDPVYAYDRIVVPAGTKVIGHIESLESASRMTRVRAMLGGNFSPPRRVMLQFDTLLLSDGRTIAIQTSAATGIENVVLQVADSSKPRGVASRAGEEVKRQATQAVSVVKKPGKAERLKEMAIRSLPYHPQFIRKGTVYSARLVSPLDFGAATPLERAAPGTAPAPESILNARLVTPFDSATAVRGMRIEAVLTQPVLSADQRIILPEGTKVIGEVTFTKRARRFHRNGQLRFLFETVQAPDRDSEKLLGALYSVESKQDDRVVLDDEGGASIRGSKARFAAPALGALALAGSMHGRLDYDTDGAGPEMQYGGVGSTSLGGFLGLGALGVGLSQLSRPVTVTIGIVGLGRTAYSAVFGRGRNVSFPADTSIQIQLAPGSATKKD